MLKDLQRSLPSLSKAQKSQVDRLLLELDPVAWGESQFYVEDTRDPDTGEELGIGPIILAPHQKRIVRAALERDMDTGDFRYTTIVYSCPKKSGKTRVAAMVTAWMAWRSPPYAECYAIANDGKQSADRVLEAIKRAVRLGDLPWEALKTRIKIPSTGAFIEAIPVDPKGEAGSQPTMSTWSEMWGFDVGIKEKLWTEMTIPPTKFGKALRWVESYAGHVGEAPTLEKLYDQGVINGTRHPGFPDLPVYINDNARLFVYWDEEPRMVWQTKEYYQSESAALSESEFMRVHRNQWVSSEQVAIPIENWDLCEAELPPLGPREPVVMGIDAAVVGDGTAVVLVSRDPRHPTDQNRVAIRAKRLFLAPAGKRIEFGDTLEPLVLEWCDRYHVSWIAYDEYQLHHFIRTIQGKRGVPHCEIFPQTRGTRIRPGRLVSDKMFYDMVIQRLIAHDGDRELRKHVQNANAKTDVDERQHMRFVKRNDNAKIDLLVAASMATCEARRLNLG